MLDLDSRKITGLHEAEGWGGGRGDEGLSHISDRGKADRIWGLSQRQQKEEVEGRPRDGAGSGAGYGDRGDGGVGVGMEMESLALDGVNGLKTRVSPNSYVEVLIPQ